MQFLKSNYFVLMGAPGTGKTAVLDNLRDQGYACITEASRMVLEEQLAINGPALPSNDPALFVKAMQLKNIEDYEIAKSIKGPVFFDRGMPDLIHYAIRFGVAPAEFEECAKKYRYNKTVFVFSPWKEIFTHDNVRSMPFEKCLEIQALLLRVYKNLGYEFREVPNGSVEKRSEFILKNVS